MYRCCQTVNGTIPPPIDHIRTSKSRKHTSQRTYISININDQEKNEGYHTIPTIDKIIGFATYKAPKTQKKLLQKKINDKQQQLWILETRMDRGFTLSGSAKLKRVRNTLNLWVQQGMPE